MPADKAAELEALAARGPRKTRNLPAVIDAEVIAPRPARRNGMTIMCHPTPEQAPLLRALLASLGVSHDA